LFKDSAIVLEWYQKCYPADVTLPQFWPLFNCGILGGKASEVKRFLNAMAEEYANVEPSFYCDMGVFNTVVALHYPLIRVFTGYPLHSNFFDRDGSPGKDYLLVHH
jgi:hypothetical protein